MGILEIILKKSKCSTLDGVDVHRLERRVMRLEGLIAELTELLIKERTRKDQRARLTDTGKVMASEYNPFGIPMVDPSGR